MSDPLTPDEDQLQTDVHLTWSYAINADLVAYPQAATDLAGQRSLC